MPIIIVDGYYDNCMNVGFDYQAGFGTIVRHVLDKHKPQKIHFMGGIKENKFSLERERVFCDILNEYGIHVDDSMKSYGDFWADPTIMVTQKLIEEGNIPDAFICANDIMAINVIAVLKENGYCREYKQMCKC